MCPNLIKITSVAVFTAFSVNKFCNNSLSTRTLDLGKFVSLPVWGLALMANQSSGSAQVRQDCQLPSAISVTTL